MLDARGLFSRVMERVRAELDWNELSTIECSEKHETYKTYFEVEMWFAKLLKEATRLGLDSGIPMRVLDLGTGPAYFPYICRLLGHTVMGLERPGSELEVFHAWVGIPVVSFTMGAKRKFPRFPIRFDVVTSFRVPFNNKRGTGRDNQRDLFDLDEWGYFLDDLRDNVLAPGGVFAMKMNAQTKHRGLRYGSPELMDYFALRGAKVDEPKPYVTFSPLR